MKCQGVNAGYCRLPMKKISSEKVEIAKDLYNKYSLGDKMEEKNKKFKGQTYSFLSSSS